MADTMLLPDCKAAWCHVEALALQEASAFGVEIGDATSIRVRNAGGDMVIQAGVRTALASIERCRASNCSLRDELGRKPPCPRPSRNQRWPMAKSSA